MTRGAGADIDIAVDLADGRVVDVDIRPRRLPPVGALVAGQPAAKLLQIVPRLFALCATAHAVAAQTAVEAAVGSVVAPQIRRQRMLAVLSERLVEQLRGAISGAGWLEQGAAAMRDLIRASATFAPARNAGVPEGLDAIARIERALSQIAGLGLAATNYLPAASFSNSGAAYLAAGNDSEVIARLVRDGARYASMPDLTGVIPETGPWARLCTAAIARGEFVDRAETVSMRIRARLDETNGLSRMLRDAVAGEADPLLPYQAVIGYRLGESCGAAAVETARGRLYHHVELDADGCVRRFQCLAPTEWNFHPEGPLARMLRGSAVATGDAGRAAIDQLIAAFDPCVGYRLTVRELADA